VAARHGAPSIVVVGEAGGSDEVWPADAAASRSAIEALLSAGAPLVHFQPIVDLADGLVVGAEALARLPTAPDGRTWFDHAAVGGAIPVLELALAEQALAHSARLPRGVYLSVNASPDVVCMPRFRRMVRAVHDRPVVVEVTEHGSATDPIALRLAREELRAAGVRIAVDDTGAGYSGLQRIAELEPDVIKLDASLAEGIDHAPVRRALVAALVGAARTLRADVVVEGIEHPEQLEALRTLNVRYGQGFLLGRPQALPLASWMPLAGHRAAVGEPLPVPGPPPGRRHRSRARGAGPARALVAPSATHSGANSRPE
jgi:EAL domain-containing protein (putative c-di-GMP-specific phosphodiesterase class I)